MMGTIFCTPVSPALEVSPMSESAPKRLLKKEKPKKSKGPVIAVVTLVAVVALLAGGYFGLCSWSPAPAAFPDTVVKL